MKLKRNNHGWCWIETCIVVALIGVLSVAIWIDVHKERVQMPEAYRAWVKQTGNPKELTYSEWRALARTREPEVIIIPIR